MTVHKCMQFIVVSNSLSKLLLNLLQILNKYFEKLIALKPFLWRIYYEIKLIVLNIAEIMLSGC